MKINQLVYDQLSPAAKALYRDAGTDRVDVGGAPNERLYNKKGMQYYEPIPIDLVEKCDRVIEKLSAHETSQRQKDLEQALKYSAQFANSIAIPLLDKIDKLEAEAEQYKIDEQLVAPIKERALQVYPVDEDDFPWPFTMDANETRRNAYIKGATDPLKKPLELRQLKDITDEEIFKVAQIVCARHNRHYKFEEITYERKNYMEVILIVKGVKRYIVQLCYDGIAFVDYYMGGAGYEHYFCPGQYQATTYLLEQGFDLTIDYHKNDE